MELLKAEATSATTTKGKLEAKGLVSKTLSELGSLWIEQSTFRRQFEIKRSMLEEKMEQAVLGDALLVDTELDSLRLDDAIIEVKQEVWC